MLQRAQNEFSKVFRQGLRRLLWDRLLGRDTGLVSYEEVKRRAGLREQRYRGLQPVDLDKIIGSLGRSRDFDRVFRPTQRHSRGKWVSVDSAYLSGISLPAVSLYKVGDAYFVVDGHHRVSVARQKGQAFIDAEVIEVKSRVPVTADLTVADLDLLGAYRDFLEQTRLDVLRPDQDTRLSMPGDYARLLEHITTHKYFIETANATELSWADAVTDWYDSVYMPIVHTIRRNNLLAEFPGLTEADLYFWVVEHSYYLTQELGRSPAPWEVAQDFTERFGRSPRHILGRLKRWALDIIVPDELEAGPPAGTWRSERVEAAGSDVLFRDILVTITGAPSGWLALEQAAQIARLEDGTLRGVHVVSSDSGDARKHAHDVLETFRKRTQEMGVEATARMVEGEVSARIVDHARWADLVVINQRREHGRVAERPLGSIFQTVAGRVARPILAVPGNRVEPIRRVLLAYDDSPKAREALYIFRHMLLRWGVSGVILWADNSSNGVKDPLAFAESYVRECAGQDPLAFGEDHVRECGEVDLAVVRETGAPYEAILRVMGSEQADLLLMGGFGRTPLVKAFVGSTVDRVLRVAWFPVIICR